MRAAVPTKRTRSAVPDLQSALGALRLWSFVGAPVLFVTELRTRGWRIDTGHHQAPAPTPRAQGFADVEPIERYCAEPGLAARSSVATGG